MSSKIANMIRKGGDSVLTAICEQVGPGEDLRWIDQLAMVCRKYRDRDVHAVGLAAPQIGVAKRVIVTNCRGANGAIKLRVMINPIIVFRSDETDVAEEQCLSYPGKSKAVRRYSKIRVAWEDMTRRRVTLAFEGFESRVIQHETDHLDGICRVGDDSPSAAEVDRLVRQAKRANLALAVVAGASINRGIQ